MGLFPLSAQTQTNGGSTYFMNMAKDMSPDFSDFPLTEYDANPKLKFSIYFVSSSTVRVRMLTSPVELKQAESLRNTGNG